MECHKGFEHCSCGSLKLSMAGRRLQLVAISRWWFQLLFLYIFVLPQSQGMILFRPAYVSNGLVQPPTRKDISFDIQIPGNGWYLV